jgi:hypothetical protein
LYKIERGCVKSSGFGRCLGASDSSARLGWKVMCAFLFSVVLYNLILCAGHFTPDRCCSAAGLQLVARIGWLVARSLHSARECWVNN